MINLDMQLKLGTEEYNSKEGPVIICTIDELLEYIAEKTHQAYGHKDLICELDGDNLVMGREYDFIEENEDNMEKKKVQSMDGEIIDAEFEVLDND